MQRQRNHKARRNGKQTLPIFFPVRKPSAAAQLKNLVIAIAAGGSRAEFKLAERLFRLLPELKEL